MNQEIAADAPKLSRSGPVFHLDLGDSENRLNGSWLDAMNAALDEIEESDSPRALVTSATGKFWSNGLDLEWLSANPDEIPGFSAEMRKLYGRMLTAPFATVAAVQGHAFAAGAVLALAHDYLVMREDRGYFCLPEVDLGIPFPEGVTEMVSARMGSQAAHKATLSGARYTGAQALAAGFVDELAPEDRVLEAAMEFANTRAAANSHTLQIVKQRLYAPVLHALEANS